MTLQKLQKEARSNTNPVKPSLLISVAPLHYLNLCLCNTSVSAPYHMIVLLGEQQDSAHVGLVVVERVQLWRGDVEGSIFREAVVQSVVKGQQVHVVHGQVVCVIPTLHVAHVDQRRSVESGARR